MKVLVTGAAGFIGHFVSLRLVERGDDVVGVDNLNDYYDVNVKLARLKRLEPYRSAELGRAEHSPIAGGDGLNARPGTFRHLKLDIADRAGMERLFAEEHFDAVINLAAQAGVRYSIENPLAYVDSNIVGFAHVLEGCRHHGVKHLVYASSSSVYGANTEMPFSVHHNVDHPLSLYAASKKANELMAHTYSHLYGLPTTGLRFFTVYGPWGRPDMALFLFTRKILAGEPIPVFNHGKHRRDFTYIDDIVEGVLRVLDRVPQGNPEWNSESPDPGSSRAPWRVYNIGNSNKVELMRYIEVLEECLGRKAEKQLLPLQPGDVPDTWADTTDLERDVGYRPNTPVEEGVRRFVEWYRAYYQVAG
ncbi:MAG: NAD-dependent epimerase [Thiotrichales bacterium]